MTGAPQDSAGHDEAGHDELGSVPSRAKSDGADPAAGHADPAYDEPGDNELAAADDDD